MSGLVGKGVRSYKKAIVSDSNFPALGFRNFIMAFEANAMGVGAGVPVDLTSALTVPSEMVAAGFEQPDPITIGNAQLGNFRNNVIVTSNLNGILIDRISYTLTNDSITFDDGLNDNEIIVIKRGNEAVTGNRIVDARPLRASGTVDFSTIGSSPVIFEVGEGFRIAPSTTATGGIDNRQIGFVQVFVDGVLQSRNVGNSGDDVTKPASEQSGNYREVIVDGLGVLLDPQNGVTANAIEFNQFQPFSSMEGVIVISTNLIVDSPNSTGVIDQVGALDARVTSTETELNRIPTPVGGTPADIIQVNSGGTAYELVTPSSAAAGVLSVTTYEVGTGGTYNIPDDATALEVEAAGAGANAGAPGGGRGGEHNTQYLPLTAGTNRTLTVTIGTAGGNTTLAGTNITDQTWLGAYFASNPGDRSPANPTFVQISGIQGGDSRARGGDGGTVGFAGTAGGGGGGGWVIGTAGASTTPGSGGHGGMVIKALGITVTAG